jgi:hypothetical protein
MHMPDLMSMLVRVSARSVVSLSLTNILGGSRAGASALAALVSAYSISAARGGSVTPTVVTAGVIVAFWSRFALAFPAIGRST